VKVKVNVTFNLPERERGDLIWLINLPISTNST
jgi:hypothetical protein